MKQYYYLAGDTQMGPFAPEDLRTQNINRNTLVWTAGMADWLRAGDVADLSSLFVSEPTSRVESMPPPQPAPTSYYQPPGGTPHPAGSYFASTPKPKNWLVESILVTLFCRLVLLVLSSLRGLTLPITPATAMGR